MWAFERGLDEAGDATRYALPLYRGALLPSEPDSRWLLPARERLRQRYLRTVLALGRAAEQRGQWREAAALYEDGLEHDSIAEELYRRLMFCHLQLSDHAAAIATWRRCRSMLSVVLGVQPSLETEAVYHRATQQDDSRRRAHTQAGRGGAAVNPAAPWVRPARGALRSLATAPNKREELYE